MMHLRCIVVVGDQTTMQTSKTTRTGVDVSLYMAIYMYCSILHFLVTVRLHTYCIRTIHLQALLPRPHLS